MSAPPPPVVFPGQPFPGPQFPVGQPFPGQPFPGQPFPGQAGPNAGGYTVPSNIPGFPIIVGPVLNPPQAPRPPVAVPSLHVSQPVSRVVNTPLDITDPEQWAHKLTLYPTKVTQEDELLLAKLQALGATAGTDGLPGFPYIGAPYIGVYNDDAAPAPQEEQQEQYDEEDVRGTQV